MRYLLIDHITDWKSGELIKGIKNVAMTEDFLEFHFPKNPIMPGILLLEALIQLCGWLEAVSSNFKNWFLITKIKKSNFYGFAFPGDQVELEVKLISKARKNFKGKQGKFSEIKSNTKIYEGTGIVKGGKKIISEFEGEIIPLEEIEDIDEQKKFFQVLTRGLKL